MRKRLYIFILICWLAGVFTLMLNPLPPVPPSIKQITYYDKAAHFVFFGISTYLLIAIGLKLRRFKFIYISIVAVILSSSLAQLGEHLQKFIPGREPSWLDFLAGLLGMLAACPIAYLIHHSPKRRLLLHVCCAPCATAVQEVLSKGYKIDFFFFNPNIYPIEEYQKRFKEVKKLAKHFKIKVFEKKYDYDDWKKSIIGYENEPEGGLRCDLCFRHRLKEAAKAADKQNYSFFATTLTISPHKKSQKINNIGNRLGRISGTPFLDQDFKDGDGFTRSVEISEELGLYRQNYCGCEYSIRKRIKI